VVLGVALTLAALFQGFAMELLTMVFVGAGAIGMAATANTVIQLTVPDELRGRVISVYTTVFVGTTPIGGLLTGAIASVAGVPAAIAVGGIGSVATGVLAFAWLRRIQAHRGVSLAAALPPHRATVPDPADGPGAAPDSVGSIVRAR